MEGTDAQVREAGVGPGRLAKVTDTLPAPLSVRTRTSHRRRVPLRPPLTQKHRMTQQHPELADEQAYVDHAYDCLETTRTSAWRMRNLTEADLGGTFQARFERNAFDEALIKRLAELDLGDMALVFGRIDRRAEDPTAIESFHIGRLAVADEDSEPVVVDWRAPVAEPFYRATGRQPMGLVRRRHFVVEGRQVLGLEDELFGDGHLGVGHDEGLDGAPGRAARVLDAVGGARAGSYRHLGRHRRHHPGRAGRDHPLAPGRRVGRAGRSGHRQDGGRAPPRRLPPVHAPLPARGAGCARHRAQPGVPALHRAGVAVAG